MTAIGEIQERLQELGLDGWLFYDHHRRDPLAYRILQLDPHRTPTRRWFYLISATGEPQALVHRIEADMLDALPGRRRSYSGWASLHEQLRDMLRGIRCVAMQHSPLCEIPALAMVDAGTIDLVRSFGIDVVSSAELVQLFEARLSQAQLEAHLEAGRRVDRIRALAFEKIRQALERAEPLNECEIAAFIRDQFRRQGLVSDHGPIVAVNGNASNPHYEPAPHCAAPVRPGDLVLIDLWAKLDQPDAIYYDITWTGYCGPDPPPRMLEVFLVVSEARDAAITLIQERIAQGRPLAGYEVDDAARNVIREAGFGSYFIHRTGHSIGAEVHGAGANMDNLESHDTRRVIEGACFSVEPGIYLQDFGIRSEVNVYVGRREARVTGEIQRELLRLL